MKKIVIVPVMAALLVGSVISVSALSEDRQAKREERNSIITDLLEENGIDTTIFEGLHTKVEELIENSEDVSREEIHELRDQYKEENEAYFEEIHEIIDANREELGLEKGQGPRDGHGKNKGMRGGRLNSDTTNDATI